MFLVFSMALSVSELDVKSPSGMAAAPRANKLNILVKQTFVSLIPCI